MNQISELATRAMLQRDAARQRTMTPETRAALARSQADYARLARSPMIVTRGHRGRTSRPNPRGIRSTS